MLFAVAMPEGCGMQGFFILYDRMPMPTDEEFADPESPFYYPSFEAARAGYRRDHVRACIVAVRVLYHPHTHTHTQTQTHPPCNPTGSRTTAPPAPHNPGRLHVAAYLELTEAAA